MEKIRFKPDRTAYVVTHAWLAVLAMTGAMVVLTVLGIGHVWTGAVAGLAAIVVRGWYLASEELSAEWTVENDKLLGPGGRVVSLRSIVQMKSLGSFVQIITSTGDKHLIKYRPDPKETIREIEAALDRRTP